MVRFPDGNGSHDYEMIDFRETLPAAGNATVRLFGFISSRQRLTQTQIYSQYGPKQNESQFGGLAVGVPGDLMGRSLSAAPALHAASDLFAGWHTLHERHGSLPWKTVFEPAINIARTGIVVNQDLAGEVAPWQLQDPLWAEVYAPNGTLVKEWDIIYRPKYANTLAKIAERGVGVLYNASSPIAQNLIKAVQASGGIMQLSDLENYKAIIRTPANITYRRDIFSRPSEYAYFNTGAKRYSRQSLRALVSLCSRRSRSLRAMTDPPRTLTPQST